MRIPGYYRHGFKNIGDKSACALCFVNKLYDYGNPDEERRHWNDTSIIDKKTGLAFDWIYYEKIDKSLIYYENYV